MDPIVSERERALYAEFDRLGIAYRTVEHSATHTVADGLAVKTALEGGHSKTLLVRDRRSLFLLVALGSVRADLKGLGKLLGTDGRLSFAKPETLMSALELTPGSLTPFGLIADSAGEVTTVVIDESLLRHDPVWAHPLRNTASTAIGPHDLIRFCDVHARQVVRADLANPLGEVQADA